MIGSPVCYHLTTGPPRGRMTEEDIVQKGRIKQGKKKEKIHMIVKSFGLLRLLGASQTVSRIDFMYGVAFRTRY